MNNGIIRKIGILACMLALMCALAGCAAGQDASVAAEQQANRAYMSQVNEAMAELDGGLVQFVDAVSRGDVVNMRTQADNAYKTLDKLESIEAPEAMADVHKDYVEGSKKMREALDAYIDLYSEISSKGKDFDWDATYEKRLAEIQKLYDEGVEKLSAADKAIGGDSASSESSSASSAESSSASDSSASSTSSSDDSASDSSASSASGSDSSSSAESSSAASA